MKKLRMKFLRIFSVLALLGLSVTVADIHADEYASKSVHACCVTCCPAHHLAPSQAVASVEKISFPIGYVVPVVFCVSVDPTDSLFRPPRVISPS